MDVNQSEEMLMKLREICLMLGWDMALNEGDDKIIGMIIGKEEFLENVINENEDYSEYVIYSPDSTSNGALQ